MAQEELWAVVMAGGSGTRFWPASRRARPKQFLPIAGSESMLAATVARLEGLVALERVLVVTSGELAPRVLECLPELPPDNVLVEPVGRNTAPCVALAALEVERRAPDAVQLVLPADHVIEPAEAFRASLEAAAAEARREPRLVTLGIRPTFPATGYGYIACGGELARHGDFDALEVERFVEKPDEARAREFLASGDFLWNAGIFVWTTDAILAALREHAPAVLEPLEAAGRSTELDAIYPELPALPIDVAVLERAAKRSVLPIDFGWNDVGSWTSLPEVAGVDGEANCSAGGGRLLAEGASGNVVYGPEGSLVALVGVKDLVVVRSGDAVLVCPKDQAQRVKDVVQRLEGESPDFL